MFVVSVRERGKDAHKFTFRKRQITVGRLRINDIILPKRNISKRHAKFEINQNNQIMVYDMGSTNGTFVNGTRATTGMLVSPTDKVFVGDYILQLQLVEDKSAIDMREPLPGGGYAMPDEGDGEVKATIAHLDTKAIQEELRRLGYGGGEEAATATLMIDPNDIPSSPPPLGEMDDDAVPAVGSDGNLYAIEVESEESVEVEMPQDEPVVMAPEVPEPPELTPEMAEESIEMEEVLDIPLEEDEEEEEKPEPVVPAQPPAPAPAPPRAAYNPPAPISEGSSRYGAPVATGAGSSFAGRVAAQPASPAVAVPKAGEPVQERHAHAVAAAPTTKAVVSARSLDDVYLPALEWWSGYREQHKDFARDEAVMELERFLERRVTGLSAADRRKTAGKFLDEFQGDGAAWEVFRSAEVHEVFVGSQGAVRGYGRHGEPLPVTGSLSCGAAVRMLAQSLCPDHDASSGTVQISGGTAFVLRSPSSGCGIRMVKNPGQPSLSGLQERQVVSLAQSARIKKLVEQGASILVLGGGPSGAALVQAMVGLFAGSRRLMMLGPGWDIAAEEARVLADPLLLFAPAMPSTMAALGVEALFGQNLPGQTLTRLLTLSGGAGVPFYASLVLKGGDDPMAIVEKLLKLDQELRPTAISALVTLSNIGIVSMVEVEGGRCRVGDVSRLAVDPETDSLMLAPVD